MIGTDDSKLLQESNLTSRQPRRAPHHVIQTTASEVIAQGPYVASRVGFEPATFQIVPDASHLSMNANKFISVDLGHLSSLLLLLVLVKVILFAHLLLSCQRSLNLFLFLFLSNLTS